MKLFAAIHIPSWNCLKFLHVFVGYQNLKETSMQQNFTDSIQFYQAACKMHPKFGGNFAPRSFAGFI